MFRGSDCALSHAATDNRSWLSKTNSAAAVDFDAMYRRLHPSIFRYLERLTGDVDVAEDVAQEAFVRLLSRPDLEEDAARLWLFTVATNLVRDRGRATTRRARLLTATPVEISRPSLPDEDLERKERIEKVRAALDVISDRDRQMLLMREEGFRYEEIADAVGVAPGSVGTLMARALKRFVAVYRPDRNE
jgi:RNA polymerase sigma-70 factor, ECF subfamily